MMSLFGLLSFLSVVLSLSLGFLVIGIVSKPTNGFTRGIISSLVKVAPGLRKRVEPDSEQTRLLIALMGGILSFVAGISPLIFYADIRLYLLFLGIGLFLGMVGLMCYGLWIYLSGR